jgi:integrase
MARQRANAPGLAPKGCVSMQSKSSPLRRTTVAVGVYRENGSYVAGFTHPLTGSWTTKKLNGVTTVAAAKKARAKLISDLEAGRVAAPSVVTLGALAAEWLAGREGRVRPRTFEADQRNVRIVSRRLGHVRLQEVDGRRIERFLQELRSGAATGNPLADRTALQTYTTLRQILERAVVGDLIAVNPCTKVARHLRPRATSTRKPHPLTPDEVQQLLDACSPAYRPIIATCAFTGCRIRECLALTWDDLNHDEKLITFSHQIDVAGTIRVPIKTDAGVRVNALVPALEEFLGREARMRSRWSTGGDYCFAARRGKSKEYRNVRRALSAAAQKAGLPHVRLHDLRHGFTSAALQYGDLATVSEYVGHASVAVTARVYSHALGSPSEKAARVAAAMQAAGLGH